MVLGLGLILKVENIWKLREKERDRKKKIYKEKVINKGKECVRSKVLKYVIGKKYFKNFIRFGVLVEILIR